MVDSKEALFALVFVYVVGLLIGAGSITAFGSDGWTIVGAASVGATAALILGGRR